MMTKRILAVLMVLMGLVGGGAAQGGGDAKPSYSGAWKLNVGKSDLGQMPPPSSQVLTIAQTANDVTITLVSDSEMGKQNYKYIAKLDGTETPLPSDAFPADSPFKIVSSKATWQGSSLVITQKTSFQDSTGTLQTTYSLSADGKTMTGATHITFGEMGFDTKSVYDKA